MDRVGEQPHGTREHHDRQLHERGQHQRDERHLDRMDAAVARFEHVVDRVGGVVAVGTEDLGEGTAETTRVLVVMMMVVVVVVIVIVTVLVLTRCASWHGDVPARDEVVGLEQRF